MDICYTRLIDLELWHEWFISIFLSLSDPFVIQFHDNS